MIRLDSLGIRNYRCIGKSHITFNKDVTVLVADNGIGKTTVLDAASLVLSQFIDELTGTRQSAGILQSDVRLTKNDGERQSPHLPTILHATGKLADQQAEWFSRRKIYGQTPRRSPKDLAAIVDTTNSLSSMLSSKSEDIRGLKLPIVAYYRSNRFALNSFFEQGKSRRARPLDGRLSGYHIYLEPLSDSQHFNKWYRRLFNSVKTRPVTGAIRQDSALQQLTVVNEAVGQVLEPTGWRTLNWSEDHQCVTAVHSEHGELPIGLLSSGIRTTIAVIADIAHRCARLNPGLGQEIARLTPGVILIDEVDLHLHPSWQQLIVGLLRAAFPSVQFILSTHSPQVLSTVDSASIRVIKLYGETAEMNPPLFQTKGVESAEVLAAVMGVDPVPKVLEAKWLSDYRAMIEQGGHEEAQAQHIKQQLLSHFGPDHPVMLDCDRLIRFTVFKRLRMSKGSHNA